MNVAFYWVSGDYARLGQIAVAAARRAMPQASILHLAGADTPALEGVDEVRRSAMPHSWSNRCLRQAEVEGDTLFLDTDVVVRRDVSGVFAQPFDVAVARREGAPPDSTKPFNGGVVFCRNPAFYLAVAQDYAQRTDGDIEMAFNTVVRSGGFSVFELPASVYNFSPKKLTQIPENCAILHYKGGLKPLMIEREIIV